MFCFFYFLCRAKRENQHDPVISVSLCKPDEIDWFGIAGLLNHVVQLQAIDASVLQAAQRGVWLEQCGTVKPLPEDFSIRGLVWAHFAIPPGWFNTDEDKDWTSNFETASMARTRANRVLYYGLRLAF
ncbi:hypothetical protein LTR56_026542, partial [Elasticomyces elasticus]